jgi:hypothetical protein
MNTDMPNLAKSALLVRSKFSKYLLFSILNKIRVLSELVGLVYFSVTSELRFSACYYTEPLGTSQGGGSWLIGMEKLRYGFT